MLKTIILSVSLHTEISTYPHLIQMTPKASPRRIHLCLCHMSGNEQRYIDEAFADNWVVPLGPNVDAFENSLQDFLSKGDPSRDHLRIAAVSAGTAAIHLGLILAGVKAGDEVICQSFTFAASANPVTYQGATPVFVDSESDKIGRAHV